MADTDAPSKSPTTYSPRPTDAEESSTSRNHKRSRSHSRSRSPRRDTRRDDARRHDRPKHKSGGFKWKDKSKDVDSRRERESGSGLNRGYKDHYRPRSRSRSRSRERERSPPPRRRSPSRPSDTTSTKDEAPPREKKKDKPPKAPKAAVPSQPMIRVTINDRLGTKQSIPCLPTDTIKDFKIIVASLIGRKPHEILLKRQGERPFKDFLTLQDYGVSHNAQLDLEVDTGD